MPHCNAGSLPLFAFAGLWTRWRGVRGPKRAPVAGEHELFGFLTTKANAVIAPIHPKAMPVILTTPDEFDRWLEADTMDALAFCSVLYLTMRCESSRAARKARGAGRAAVVTTRFKH